MSGHTPGPWRFDAEYGRVEADGRRVCDMPSAGLSLYPEEYEANARLIAAAPEMLEALREAEDLVGFHEGCEEVPRPGMHPQVLINAEDYRKILGALRAGIAAATGEEVGA